VQGLPVRIGEPVTRVQGQQVHFCAVGKRRGLIDHQAARLQPGF
jgi:hypothetical protein